MTSDVVERAGYQRIVEKPWGFENVITEPSLPYVGKLIHVRAGHRLSLQVHDTKVETMTVLSGSAILVLEDDYGTLQTLRMERGPGYTIRPGRKHRLCATTDTVVLEVSSPECGITFRLEDDYGRPDERRL